MSDDDGGVSDGDGGVSGYRIRYAKSCSDDYDSIDVNSDQIETKITALEANTVYRIQVAGLFQEGKLVGPYSDSIEGKTVSGEFM